MCVCNIYIYICVCVYVHVNMHARATQLHTFLPRADVEALCKAGRGGVSQEGRTIVKKSVKGRMGEGGRRIEERT